MFAVPGLVEAARRPARRAPASAAPRDARDRRPWSWSQRVDVAGSTIGRQSVPLFLDGAGQRRRPTRRSSACRICLDGPVEPAVRGRGAAGRALRAVAAGGLPRRAAVRARPRRVRCGGFVCTAASRHERPVLDRVAACGSRASGSPRSGRRAAAGRRRRGGRSRPAARRSTTAVVLVDAARLQPRDRARADVRREAGPAAVGGRGARSRTAGTRSPRTRRRELGIDAVIVPSSRCGGGGAYDRSGREGRGPRIGRARVHVVEDQLDDDREDDDADHHEEDDQQRRAVGAATAAAAAVVRAAAAARVRCDDDDECDEYECDDDDECDDDEWKLWPPPGRASATPAVTASASTTTRMRVTARRLACACLADAARSR